MMVMLGSAKYLSSPNCLRELAAAEAHALRLVRVHDAEKTKNGAPLDELRRSTASTRFPHSTFLFGEDADGPVIPWHRVAAFQLNALAAIAEQLLLASPAYANVESVSLHVEGGLAWAQPTLTRPLALYTSAHNPPAAAAARALCELLPEMRLVTAAEAATSWLLFLGPKCFEGERGEQLTAEVAAALHEGVKLVMLWSPDAADDGCDEFREIIESTPPSLIEAGLFGPLAIEWRSGLHRAVGERLVAKALGARMGRRWDEAAREGVSACVASVASVAASTAMACSELVRRRKRVVSSLQGSSEGLLLTLASARKSGEQLSSRKSARGQRDGRSDTVTEAGGSSSVQTLSL